MHNFLITTSSDGMHIQESNSNIVSLLVFLLDISRRQSGGSIRRKKY